MQAAQGRDGDDDVRAPEGEDGAACYAKGWLVRPIKKDTRRLLWHDGSMEGTSGMVVQRDDGVGFAMLFNTRQQVDNTDPGRRALEVPLHKVLNVVFAEKNDGERSKCGGRGSGRAFFDPG